MTAARLLRCAGCKAIFYCGKEHQADHRRYHKRVCDMVKKARKDLAAEEARLRDYEALPNIKISFFDDEYIGVLGRWGETSKYLEDRRKLALSLTEVGTYTAIAQVYDLMVEMLRMDRTDHVGIRFMFPSVCLRLGKHQEVYDFCEWYRRNWNVSGLLPSVEKAVRTTFVIHRGYSRFIHMICCVFVFRFLNKVLMTESVKH